MTTATAARGERERGSSPGVDQRPGLRALAIDDEPAILATFRRAFHREVQLVTESDPSRALELLEAQAFDIVFVDYSMPGMNGVVFLEGAHRLRPEMRAYLVTAHAATAEILEAVRRGLALGVIAKPWSRHEILCLLRGPEPP
jgi:CheY-like chemotaxis protein